MAVWLLGLFQNQAFLECPHTTHPVNAVLMGEGRVVIVEVLLPGKV